MKHCSQHRKRALELQAALYGEHNTDALPSLACTVGVFFQDKTTVIQEARVFNESPISPRKCRILLTKIIYLLYIGETFGTQEATTLFFGVTKLFQHKDVGGQI